jgi:GNAT superfamily N-acetyltransferase
MEMPPAEDDQAPVEVRPGGISCGTINARAMEASLVIRQHASALSVGVDPEARAQGIVLLAYLDQWAGRLRGLIDLGDYSECLDDGEAETYRRALATATRVGNQAREELFRPVRAPQPTQQRNRRP